MATHSYHEPVLLSETLGLLNLEPGAAIIDGTLGGGGHAEAILEQTGPDGLLIGLDLDGDALRESGKRLAGFGERVYLAQASFRRMEDVVADLRAMRPNIEIDGIVLDLGVSSHQLDEATRGFRFSDGDESPLDMRMDGTGSKSTAADFLATWSAEELEKIFSEYGQLPGSRRLARAIVERRDAQPLENAKDLLSIIRDAGIGRGRKHNPATLVFQALRIAVNDEMGALADGLAAAIRVLRPGGRLAVIAYHSLEDRMVKHTLRDAAKGCICPPDFPVCRCDQVPTMKVVTRRPVGPSEAELSQNPRARSARLRAGERKAAA